MTSSISHVYQHGAIKIRRTAPSSLLLAACCWASSARRMDGVVDDSQSSIGELVGKREVVVVGGALTKLSNAQLGPVNQTSQRQAPRPGRKHRKQNQNDVRREQRVKKGGREGGGRSTRANNTVKAVPTKRTFPCTAAAGTPMLCACDVRSHHLHQHQPTARRCTNHSLEN